MTRRSPGDPLPTRSACAAPAMQLRFDPNGLVTSCCRTIQPLGHISRDRLVDIWNGVRRHELVAALDHHDYSHGCQRCGAEVATEGPEHAYATAYDGWLPRLEEGPPPLWPLRAEFNLSNVCNLQCVQCDGESSSMIRLHREHRRPLPKVYDDRFFDDLVPFLEHMEEAVFAGGEPFLAPESYRVWELIARHAPHLRCSVVTNATQWSPRVAEILDRLRMDVVVSLDGITRETYEAIRIGSDFESVMSNIERLIEHRSRTGASLSINHCLMPQNHHELGQLLTWADQRRIPVNVCIVRTPAHCSIARQPIERIREIDRALADQAVSIRPGLTINAEVWDEEHARIRSWIREATDSGPASHTVMFFQCQGAGPTDDAGPLAELRAADPEADLIRVAIGTDDVVRWCEWPSTVHHVPLEGSSYQILTEALTNAYGDLVHWGVTSTSDDRVDATAQFGERLSRIIYLAQRDDTGWADEVRVLISIAAGVDGRGTTCDGSPTHR